MHDIRNPAYVFFGTLAAAFLLCDLHLAAQALPKDSTSPTTGVKPPAPSFWEDFYWKAWPKEAAGQVSCSGTPHNGRPHAELTVIAPTKRVATGWVVATDSIDRVVLNANWITRFNLPDGGPYTLKVTSQGGANAGHEEDETSHGHTPARGWSRLAVERSLSVHLRSPVNEKPWKRSKRDEWRLDFSTHGNARQARYHDYDEGGSHLKSTPLAMDMSVLGPGMVEVVETFSFTQTVSAVQECGWTDFRLILDPLKWELSK